MAEHSFQPGDKVIWAKNAGGGFAFPVAATVTAVTPKRVTIQAHDPDETGEGIVIRHVHPASLQPKVPAATRQSPKRAVPKRRALSPKALPPADSFEARYPHIASWVQDGWIEIGRDDCGRSFLRAYDIGGLVWEGDERYASLDEALRALDQGIAGWLEEIG